MRLTLLAATALLALAPAARASVTYTLANPVYNQQALDGGARIHPFAPLDITVSDAAVARGTFSVTLEGWPGGFVVRTGDLADFVSFHGREAATGARIAGQLTASLSFAADGSVSAGSIDFYGEGDALRFSGSGADFGGQIASEQYQGCNLNDGCRLTGQLVAGTAPAAVPEPASAALLGAGLLGVAVRRRPQNGTIICTGNMRA